MSVDVTPLGFEVSTDGQGTVSVAASAEIPGGLLGVSGGVTIDTNTGEITGGSIGGEVAGIGLEISKSENGFGLEVSFQIPGTPISVSLGFGSPDKQDEEKTPTPGIEDAKNGFEPENPDNWPALDQECNYGVFFLFVPYTILFEECIGFINYGSGSGFDFKRSSRGRLSKANWNGLRWDTNYRRWLPKLIEEEEEGRINLVISNASVRYTQGDKIIKGYDHNVDGVEVGGSLLFLPEAFGSPIYLTGGGPYQRSIGQIANAVANPINYPNHKIIFQLIEFCPNSNSDTLPIAPSLLSTPPTPPTPTPFPNPPPRKEEVDTCCQENLKMLRAIYKGLGIAKFPGKLPATIIQEVAKKGQEPAEPAQVPIADFVDLLDWQFRRDDERWGQWEIQIDVKDTDLTKEGDQGKSIKFPNLAESIAELEGQMLSVMANVDALIAITTKSLVESGMARQEAIKSYLAAKAIIKYMAFKSTEIDVPVPMTFTAGAETISALIEESEGHIKGTDYVEKETLRDILLDLLQAAAVIRAVHWQKIDSKTDTKSQLLSLLKGTVDLAGIITSPKKSNDGEKKFDPTQNFEDFLDSAEDGFRNTTGITDIQNPYGKTPDRRPRIRQIGDNISQAGGDN